MSGRLAARALEDPHPSRLARTDPYRAEILAAHAAAMSVGESGYLYAGTGLFVFTAAFLAAQGTCCDAGCRHCPYLD